MLSAIAAGLSDGQFPEASRITGYNRQQLSAAKERFDLWLDGDVEALYDARGKIREDSTPVEWLDFGKRYWLSQCRASEKAKDSIRDPKNRADKSRYRIHWKEDNVDVLYQKCLPAGKEELSTDFHISAKQFREVKPFQVKSAGRDVCMCIYHLRWELMCSALRTARQGMRDSGAVKCQCEIHHN